MPKVTEKPRKAATKATAEERDLAVLRHVAASPGLSAANAPKGYKAVIARLVKSGFVVKRDGLCYLTEGGQRRVGRFNGLLPHVCKACMRWPCVCEQDAEEAVTMTAAEKYAATNQPRTVVLRKDGPQGGEWSLTKLPSGEVLQQFRGDRRIEKRIVSYADARTLYNALRSKGWQLVGK